MKDLLKNFNSINRKKKRKKTVNFELDLKLKIVAYAKKHSQKEAAEKFDTSAGNVQRWCSLSDKGELNIESSRIIPEKTKLEVIRYAKETSQRQASIKYKFDQSGISRWIRERNKLSKDD